MLPLPTGAAIEATNTYTDQCHPSHTYDCHNLLRRFLFTQQDITVNTDDVERNIEISTGKLY